VDTTFWEVPEAAASSSCLAESFRLYRPAEMHHICLAISPEHFKFVVIVVHATLLYRFLLFRTEFFPLDAGGMATSVAWMSGSK
jgi:hypothetical protein